jgi:hypothetical protein
MFERNGMSEMETNEIRIIYQIEYIIKTYIKFTVLKNN